MNDQMNTIFGWTLASLGIALGGAIVSGKVFTPIEGEGYIIEVAEEEGGADAGPSLAELLAAADPAAGEQVFARCSTCHTVEQGGANGIGPNLYGIMGATIAGKPGFGYSAALSGKGGNWTWEDMNAWLESPRAYADGTSMSFAGLGNPEDRANLMAYLNSMGSNLQLPEVEAAPEGEEIDGAGEGPGAVEGEESDAVEAAGAMGADQPVAENPGVE